jgi:hypothetical protein
MQRKLDEDALLQVLPEVPDREQHNRVAAAQVRNGSSNTAQVYTDTQTSPSPSVMQHHLLLCDSMQELCATAVLAGMFGLATEFAGCRS